MWGGNEAFGASRSRVEPSSRTPVGDGRGVGLRGIPLGLAETGSAAGRQASVDGLYAPPSAAWGPPDPPQTSISVPVQTVVTSRRGTGAPSLVTASHILPGAATCWAAGSRSTGRPMISPSATSRGRGRSRSATACAIGPRRRIAHLQLLGPNRSRASQSQLSWDATRHSTRCYVSGNWVGRGAPTRAPRPTAVNVFLPPYETAGNGVCWVGRPRAHWPAAMAPRSVRQALLARSTTRPCASVTSQSTTPMVRPA